MVVHTDHSYHTKQQWFKVIGTGGNLGTESVAVMSTFLLNFDGQRLSIGDVDSTHHLVHDEWDDGNVTVPSLPLPIVEPS